MTLSWLRWGRLFLIFPIFLVACLPSESANHITFMVFGDPAEQAAFKAVVEGYMATNPAVPVEIVAMPSKEDYMARLTADFAAGSPPDVFLLNYRRMTQFYNPGALEPLGPRLQASEVLNEADYYPVALDAFRDREGTLICIPQNISSQVVYYNQDLFDAAGVAYPTAGWTWEDFRQTALAMTLPDTNQDGEADQYGLGLEPTIMIVTPFIWQNGGELVDDRQNPTRLTLDDPATLEAIQFVMNLSLEDQVLPNFSAEVIQAQQDRFYSGNIAMYINSRRIVPVMREVIDFNWDVAPIPQGKEAANVLHSDGYCMAADTEVKEAAWNFVEFAIGDEGQKLASVTGRTVPSIQRVAESPVFLDDTQPPANAQAWLDTVPHLRILPRLENWSVIERSANIEFEIAFQGRSEFDLVISNILANAAQRFQPIK